MCWLPRRGGLARYLHIVQHGIVQRCVTQMGLLPTTQQETRMSPSVGVGVTASSIAAHGYPVNNLPSITYQA